MEKFAPDKDASLLATTGTTIYDSCTTYTSKKKKTKTTELCGRQPKVRKEHMLIYGSVAITVTASKGGYASGIQLKYFISLNAQYKYKI